MIMMRSNSFFYLTALSFDCAANEWAELCRESGVMGLCRIQANMALGRAV
ncbi:hypothetical protein [Halopseudomonas sp.]|tara:strand:+ start:1698 stop:1847 length:150 start_codon:yes stop_codon:yes gene_type:complete